MLSAFATFELAGGPPKGEDDGEGREENIPPNPIDSVVFDASLSVLGVSVGLLDFDLGCPNKPTGLGADDDIGGNEAVCDLAFFDVSGLPTPNGLDGAVTDIGGKEELVSCGLGVWSPSPTLSSGFIAQYFLDNWSNTSFSFSPTLSSGFKEQYFLDNWSNTSFSFPYCTIAEINYKRQHVIQLRYSLQSSAIPLTL
jgi:hypothetical protein